MEQIQDKESTFSFSWLIMELAVIFSVFSQIESIERITRPGMYAIWAVAIVYGGIKYHGNLPITRFSQGFIVAYMLFLVLCAFTGLLNSRHLSANYIRVLIVPLLVTIAGDMYADEQKELFNRLGKVYLICAVVFALWVQKTYFPSYTSWLNTKIYLFQEKNSAGQIWVAAIFISIMLIEYKNRFQQVLAYIACFYLLIMTGMSQCRTALLGVAVAVIAFAVYRAKHKGRWIIFILVVAATIWFIPVTRAFIEQALFLNKYAGADLNTFSSGRIGRYETAFQDILSSPLIGAGKYYVDCSYILITAESGILGFILIEWIWFKKIGMCYRFQGEPGEQAFLFVMATFYIFESILEGYPPFGPGVSSFMFWFMSSVLINRRAAIESEDKKYGHFLEGENVCE